MLPSHMRLQCVGGVKTRDRQNNRELINNSKTLPSPLRSSAGSRRACRKQDSRGGGERRERKQRGERETERERKHEAEWRKEGERRKWLEHGKP